MSESYKKLIKTLRTIFEMDKADLDFGIYRIMNQKRNDINNFLEDDLLPQVKKSFSDYVNIGANGLKTELQAAIEQAKQYGSPDPENTQPVLDIKNKMALVDATSLENDVFSKLHTFFNRYYDKGDFISQRRYKSGTYSIPQGDETLDKQLQKEIIELVKKGLNGEALEKEIKALTDKCRDINAIPYEGEEVKLYWANHDQYYIKSSEHLRDYAFIAKDKDNKDKPFRIKLVEADTEKDNVKAKTGEERRFVIDEETLLSVEDGQLLIHFNFLPVGKKKQEALNKHAVDVIFNQTGEEFEEWLTILKQLAPTEANKNRTLLEKHLNDYTARNTFDYFIHKDLGGFLNRELDFYIKNEVLFLDDIDDKTFEVTEQQLRKIKILRSIAKKIIRMLAQLENFQKKLWLKKKFVVETNYCITIDRVDSSLFDIIANENEQWNEWLLFNFINSVQASPENRIDTLKRVLNLVLDTRYFNEDFKQNLIGNINNLDTETNGILLNSENYQGLNLIKSSQIGKVKVVVTDPPYNSGGNDFNYKDSFRNSSWLSMMSDRIEAARDILSDDGVLFVNIDDKDEDNRVSHRLMNLIEDKFGNRNYLDNLIWVKNTTHNDAKAFSHNHEYILAFAKNRHIASAKHEMFRESKPGFAEVMELVHELNEIYPSIEVIKQKVRALYKEQTEEYKELCLDQGLVWTQELKKNNPWKGITQYKYADYRDENGVWIDESDARIKNAKIWIWREDNPSWPNASSLKDFHKSADSDEYRFYKPPHPVTGGPCGCPERGWLWRETINPEKTNVLSFESLDKQHLIAYGEDENKKPQIKRFLHKVSTDVVKSVISDFTDGEKELSHIVGERGTFPNPKPSTIGRRLIEMTTEHGSTVLDMFAGSGTTGHALLQQNFIDDKERKFILIEMGHHFDDTLLPRIKKCSFATHWKEGQPVSQGHQSLLIKYLRLEGYEDTLNNLKDVGAKRSLSNQQQSFLDESPSAREDYTLGYWLDVETENSASLLDIKQFEDPFNYKLNIGSGSVGATKPTNIDLVETFNYLLGLTVKSIDVIRGFKVVIGFTPQDESVLVIWRKLAEKDNAALDEFLDKQGYNPRDTEFNRIYVNGDHTLEDPFSKVKMIEIEFKRLMFDVKEL
ncbi:site-specific DNA-methyltransferase [Shewanella abyssi]|uniref:site-specific DNA-methyltransferase n=1 Tax=Shewanella abyssi TaxID=311789 RepID=UPI00200ED322|nr:site-specific DNA-methyltransferase [Shewanella abyssi]MCL1051879.1 site-specific DNA-methyltransferase [Shewanella abyssi]